MRRQEFSRLVRSSPQGGRRARSGSVCWRREAPPKPVSPVGVERREADLSTEQARSQAPARLPRPQRHGRRPQGSRRASRARPQASFGLILPSAAIGRPPASSPAMREPDALVTDAGRTDDDGSRPGRGCGAGPISSAPRAAGGPNAESFALQARARADGEVDEAGPRVGFTVTRKIGGAVERNRIRRRLKAALRRRKRNCAQCSQRLRAGGAPPGVDAPLRGAGRRRGARLRADRPREGRPQPTETRDHEFRGLPQPHPCDRAVGPGADRLAVFLRRAADCRRIAPPSSRRRPRPRRRPAPRPAPLRRPSAARRRWRRRRAGAGRAEDARRGARARARESRSTRRASAARST